MENKFDLNDIEVANKLGKIQQCLEDLCNHVKIQNGRVSELEKYKNKTEMLFGKVGIIVIAIGFVAATAWNIFIEFIKDKIFKV
jgi:hypothetical protein